MTVHLIKLCVGRATLAELIDSQAQRLAWMVDQGHAPELMHVTRAMPRRAAEVLDGGSLYWVIGGWIAARQRLVELRPLIRDGVPHCGLIYDRQIVRVAERQRRPFQGWRYLEPDDAPPDLRQGDKPGIKEMPETMRRELRALGLI